MSLPSEPLHDIADLTLWSWSHDNEKRIAKHLEFIGDIDLEDESYSFDILRLYVRKADGAILYATDSGCSCPAPFEDVQVKDLIETSLAGMDDVLSSHLLSYGLPLSEIRKQYRELRPALIEAGAK